MGSFDSKSPFETDMEEKDSFIIIGNTSGHCLETGDIVYIERNLKDGFEVTDGVTLTAVYPEDMDIFRKDGAMVKKPK